MTQMSWTEFPAEDQDMARARLADSLHSIVSQRLLPRADGKGRAAALEILVATPVVRDLIRDRNRVGEIREHMAGTREQNGSQTFDQHLVDLVESGVVTSEVAVASSGDPAEFERQLKLSRKSLKGGTAAPKNAAVGSA
ncbi:MAG: hypothetical protein EXR93_02640 [Gemmatimonadetes bacterium]|nr:hypothetical protein [Gemmatimonadota bacterium]